MDCRLKTGPNPRPLDGIPGISLTSGSGEVEGVVDFRDEEVVLLRSFEDEAAEGDNRSDFFPDEDGEEAEGGLCFRDVIVEMEGAVESCRREVTLVSVELVEVIRLVGSAVTRVLGRGGDFEAAAFRGLVTFPTCL